eukprot:NODE_26_length_35450_cov_0.398320.p28 type:complete len:111 gc:universal NODE_26_length_35450_cov_0.398320:29051-28719(-)
MRPRVTCNIKEIWPSSKCCFDSSHTSWLALNVNTNLKECGWNAFASQQINNFRCNCVIWTIINCQGNFFVIYTVCEWCCLRQFRGICRGRRYRWRWGSCRRCCSYSRFVI